MDFAPLQVTRQFVPGKPVLVCIPGTYCAPDVFDGLNETTFPLLQVLPVSWMTSAGPWDIPTLGRRVAALLRELNAGPVLVAGHSTGGIIALMAALAESALVSGLLLADTGANTQGHGDIISTIKAIESGISAPFMEMLLRRSFATLPPPELLQRLNSYGFNVPREAALEALKSQAQVDVVASLPMLTMPAVIVHGRLDQARPVAHAELLAEHLPRAELRLLDTGHTPMVEDPEGYAQALSRLCELVGIPTH